MLPFPSNRYYDYQFPSFFRNASRDRRYDSNLLAGVYDICTVHILRDAQNLLSAKIRCYSVRKNAQGSIQCTSDICQYTRSSDNIVVLFRFIIFGVASNIKPSRKKDRKRR